MALVVYVFATVLMLAEGLRETLVSTGQPDNVVVIRRSSQSEVQSGIDRTQASIVESLPDIMTGADGRKLVSKEPVVLINLPKRDSGKPSNVTIRGITAEGIALRPQVVLAEDVCSAQHSEVAPAARSPAAFAAPRSATAFRSRDWNVVVADAAVPINPRSGATLSRCCRRSGAPLFCPSSGSTMPTGSKP
jgi:hypothetical protein